MKVEHTQDTRGVTAIEVVLGVSLAALILTFATNAIMQFINTGRLITEKTQALYLAEDGLELLRFLRDEDWSNFNLVPLNATRYLSLSGGTIAITTTPENIEGFRRSFTIQNVYRNGFDDIVASTTSGASADAQSKYVTVFVFFGSPTTTISLTSILTEIDP